MYLNRQDKLDLLLVLYGCIVKKDLENLEPTRANQLATKLYIGLIDEGLPPSILYNERST